MSKRVKQLIVIGSVALVCVVAIVLIWTLSIAGTERHKHTMTYVEAVEATCAQGGTVGYWRCTECEKCFADEQGTDLLLSLGVPALGHDFGEFEVVTQVTCTQDGERVSTCSRCGEAIREELPATGHEAGEEIRVTTKEPTCAESGSYDKVVQCVHCGEDLRRDHFEIAARGHTWNSGVVTQEATCAAEGVRTYTCTRCGETREEAIATTAHTPGEAVRENEQAATCTEPGSYDLVVHCTVCGGEVSRTRQESAAGGHDWDDGRVAAPATCAQEGERAYLCTRCGAIQKEVIEKLPHTPGEAVRENEQDATCTESGSYETVTYCTVCGSEVARKTADVTALGHDWGTGSVIQQPTCTASGTQMFTCTRCSETRTEPVAALGHEAAAAVRENVVGTTCEAPGSYDSVVRCKRCRMELSREHIQTDALGHDWDEGRVTVPATCAAEGERTYLCTRCGEAKKEAIAKTAHTPGAAVHENEQAATCVDPGSYESVVYCTVCGAEIGRETAQTPALGHEISDEWSHDGSIHYKTCAHDPSEQLEAARHTYVEGVCIVCGYIRVWIPTEGLEYEQSPDGSHYIVVGPGTVTDSDIVIPDEYNDLPVTEIGDRAFYDRDGIITVQLPDSIVHIGDKAFSECDNLLEIEMPDTAEVGEDVFRGSIHIIIIIRHHTLVFVEAKEPTCTVPGNIEHYYCAKCDEYYKDAAGTIRIYDVTIPSAHHFVDGVCTVCGEILGSILIVEVDEVPYLGKFPLGTLENAIGLPAAVNVWTQDGRQHTLDVQWDLSSYDKSVAGSYTIVGHIIAPDFRFDEGVSDVIEAQVDIVEQIQGTADIVFVLDISGSMTDDIANVKDNIIEFSQRLEEQGVSARWSAVTFSDFTYDVYEESKIIQNGASDWFISADEYKEAIGTIDMRSGGDSPEASVDGLMLANTLTTRQDARVFYILLTDSNYKNDNNHGVSGMTEATDILADRGVNVSVVTASTCKSYYTDLYESTGGVYCNIKDGNFSQDLMDHLVPIIFGEVIA